MPPTAIHLNGSINLSDAETVLREVSKRLPTGLRRVPDGETGDRGNWILFQLDKFQATPGLEPANDPSADSYQTLPKVRLTDGADPGTIEWPDLGYANAYLASFEIFSRLQRDGVLSPDLRYQVQYPTPLASINSWVVPEHQAALEDSYRAALFADLRRLLAELPSDHVAVQWDVAVEFAVLEQQRFASRGTLDFDSLAARLADCVNQVPAEVPVGMHLCYGDFQHQHFAQPKSLAEQVRMLNTVTEQVNRAPDWCSFTVPQDRGDADYFAPLAELRADPRTELYFGLVPYHPKQQEPGVTDSQVRLIDQHLGGRPWGVSTECGMGRVPTEEVPTLLDLHRQLIS